MVMIDIFAAIAYEVPARKFFHYTPPLFLECSVVLFSFQGK